MTNSSLINPILTGRLSHPLLHIPRKQTSLQLHLLPSPPRQLHNLLRPSL